MDRRELNEYFWRKGAPYKKSHAKIFGRRADWIERQLGRAPTPEDILKDARNPKSPIHEMFLWDNRKAAEKFRLQQAGNYLSAIQIHVTIQGSTGPRILNVPVRTVLAPRTGVSQGHEHLANILSNKEKRERMLEIALDELDSVRTKYRFLTELASIFDAIDQGIQKHKRGKVAA